MTKIKKFKKIIERLKKCDGKYTEEFKKILQEWTIIDLINDFENKLQNSENKIQLINDKSNQESKKLCIFGKLSSGKTRIINGIIGQNLFKSSSQHTTRSFVHIRKSGSTNYKISHDGIKKCFDNIKEAKDEINKLSTKSYFDLTTEDNFEPYKSMDVFIPVDANHKIIKNHIEIIDSPGSGNREVLTNYIKNYAKYTDIFIFVLMHDITEDDEQFFKFQFENSTKPDIFVLINKWDETDLDEDEEIEQTKTFLKAKCDRLIRKMNERIVDVGERTYFISANEVFDIRINNNNEYLTNNKKKQRYENFEKFESKLSEYIQNKKKKFSQELEDIKIELSNDFQNFQNNILNIISSDFIEKIKNKRKQLENYVWKMENECEITENKCIEDIKCKALKMMNTMNFHNLNEIQENIKKHYLSIDEDIKRLDKSLEDKLSLIQENYDTNEKHLAKNEIQNILFHLGKKDLKIQTDLRFENFPKSKVAVGILSLIPVVGFIATNILIYRINNAQERNLNIETELENEIHARDEDRINEVKENISEIKNNFIKEITKIRERHIIEMKYADFLKEAINSHDSLSN